MASSNWKKVELGHCRELGGERTGPTGRDLPDCIGTPFLGLEIKAYKRFVFLSEDWKQTVHNASKLDVIPALLVREGGRGGRRQVQMFETDFGRLWAPSGLRPIRPLVQDVERDLVRIEWADFVRLYRAFITEVTRQVEE